MRLPTLKDEVTDPQMRQLSLRMRDSTHNQQTLGLIQILKALIADAQLNDLHARRYRVAYDAHLQKEHVQIL